MSFAMRKMLMALGPLVVLLGMLLGCGGNTTTVEGNVTFDGKPVEQGSIVFEPADGMGSGAGGTIQNGKYQLGAEGGMVPGKMLVRISAVGPTGKKIEAGSPEPPGTMVDEVRQYIPAIYNDNSTLTLEVAAGKVTHNFELQSQPAPR